MAIAFAREGADIVFIYLPEEENDGITTLNWIEKAGRRGIPVSTDLSIQANCENLAKQAFQEFGNLDLLVNIAAFQSTHDNLEDISIEEFDRTLKTNVYALFWLCQEIIPKMQPGSAVINTGSIQSYEPSAHLIAYAATKAAIVSMTKTLSDMGMKNSVRENAVAPGPVWTPLIPAAMEEEEVKKFGRDTVFGKPATG